MGGTEIDYIQDAFDKNWIAPLGENVNKFEEAVKNYTGAKNALALSSGTAALHLALIESGVGEGDIVFCSSLTFSASANPILYQNATPVFIDSEMDTWNMSPIALEKAFKKYEELNQLPKAVIVVNLYGQSAKMNEILKICKKYNTLVIEDAAESLGSTYFGQQSGTFGDFGVYSFNGNKIITTSGGGMLVSRNQEKIANALFLATQARDKALHYEHSTIGYNYRLSNISAGIGRGQMKVLDQRIKERRKIFRNYYEALNHFDGFEFQPILEGFTPNRWLTALTIDKEKSHVSITDLINHLAENNIEARPVWKPMHLQPIFKKYDYIKEQEDNSKWLFDNGICLPSGSNLSIEEQEFVINKIKAFVLE